MPTGQRQQAGKPFQLYKGAQAALAEVGIYGIFGTILADGLAVSILEHKLARPKYVVVNGVKLAPYSEGGGQIRYATKKRVVLVGTRVSDMRPNMRISVIY